MQIPLTSLSYIDWLVWADWCGEYRPKAEGFARKVGHALQKMHVAGVEPKCALAFQAHNIREWYLFLRLHPSCRPVWEPDFFKVYCRRWNWQLTVGFPFGLLCVGEWRWLTPNETRRLMIRHELELRGFRECDIPKWSPADLHQPERQRRLITKFWRVVVRRATGISESVLKGVSDATDGGVWG